MDKAENSHIIAAVVFVSVSDAIASSSTIPTEYFWLFLSRSQLLFKPFLACE